jgi:hypothetical protein
MLYSEIIAVCSQIHTKHTNNTVSRTQNLSTSNLLVYKVTTGLWRFKNASVVILLDTGDCMIKTFQLKTWTTGKGLGFMLQSF